MVLKLKLQYLATWCKELTLWKIPWSWERVFPKKYPEGKRRRERQRMRWLNSITNNGLVLEQTLGVSGGQRSLACYRPWGHKESDTTWQLNKNNNMYMFIHIRRCIIYYSMLWLYQKVNIMMDTWVISNLGLLF